MGKNNNENINQPSLFDFMNLDGDGFLAKPIQEPAQPKVTKQQAKIDDGFRNMKKQIIKDSLPLLDTLSNLINSDKNFNEPKKEFFGGLYSSFLNYGFNNFYKSSKKFKVDYSCIKCKKCITVCPLNNVSMKNGNITFLANCMFCLSCINNCPVNAITYNGKKNGTYLCPSKEKIFK